MNDWIDYYDSAHSIYVNAHHRDVHFETVAKAILQLIPSPDAVVIDWSCGEALSSRLVAAACGRLILAEPAKGVRERLTQRFRDVPNIEVCSLDDLDHASDGSIDLIVMNSVSQYMDDASLDAMLAKAHRLLAPHGELVIGDVLHPDVGVVRDALALLKFAHQNGFLIDAFTGLLRMAVSDYRSTRSKLGLKTYVEDEMLARLRKAHFTASRASNNLGFNQWRMTFKAVPQNP